MSAPKWGSRVQAPGRSGRYRAGLFMLALVPIELGLLNREPQRTAALSSFRADCPSEHPLRVLGSREAVDPELIHIEPVAAIARAVDRILLISTPRDAPRTGRTVLHEHPQNRPRITRFALRPRRSGRSSGAYRTSKPGRPIGAGRPSRAARAARACWSDRPRWTARTCGAGGQSG